eukprot:TRINITY_DN22283_c0_g1_i1.p1 TRINITY_DN22283_c0_g1~~TRINITY_DN22283_c0_g1_i1.p1  ORF type:complete len:268 (+),score=80.67 TRINITY_DN22283_c0_g1_i1:117-920(+)
MAATAMTAATLVLKPVSTGLNSTSSVFQGQQVAAVQKVAPVVRSRLVCTAEKEEAPVSRRAALTLFAAAAAVAAKAGPANAAYGQAANVFGAAKKQSGFTPYEGSGFALELPSKWNPSKEVEFAGQVLRYEDNFDALANIVVLSTPASKGSIESYGSPEAFITEFNYLLGTQSYAGNTSSEGGFAANAVATASLLESELIEQGGKKYYLISVLTRTADGDEGGRHHVIKATVSNGKLWIVKSQAGDKRWFKGAQKFVEGAVNSFKVA